MIRAIRTIGACALVLVLQPLRVVAQTTSDVVARAMADELARSMQDLHTGQLERPYFVAYAVHDIDSRSVSASGGYLQNQRTGRSRFLSVEVRVGDYKFDNTNFMNVGGAAVFANEDLPFGGGNELPLDDDYREIRRQIWLATDAAYKEAAQELAGKRASLLNRAQSDTLSDFLRVAPTHTVDDDQIRPVSDADLDSLVRTASRSAMLPSMTMASASMTVTTVRTRYLNSEGTSYDRSRQVIALNAGATTQAVDGTPLADGLSVTTTRLDDLRPQDIAARVRRLAVRLDSLRRAPLAVRYVGPVLFEGEAAAVLFSGQFGSALSARRRPSAGGDLGAYAASFPTNSMADRIGGRVLPDFLSVVDDPTRMTYGTTPLLGRYKVDDEGVAAQRTSVVENGILKSVLTTRTPVDGVDHSTGNDRGGAPLPSNLIVTVSDGLNEHDLIARLSALAGKRGLPYAILVRDIGGINSADQMMSLMSRATGRVGQSLLAVYRVYPDGRQELVRGVQLADFTLASFKDIIAAGDSGTVYQQERASMQGIAMMMAAMMGRYVPTAATASSYVVPSLLFDEATLVQTPRTLPDLPFSAPPEGTQ